MAEVFLSYSWTDNVGANRALDDQWVTEFRNRLEARLRGLIGRRPVDPEIVWQDVNNLRGLGTITRQLEAILDEVSLFCAIYSPSFFNSDFCLTELSRFKRRISRTMPAGFGPDDLIVKVLRLPVGNNIPNTALGYTFFELTQQGAPVEIDSSSREYITRLANLAHQIYKALLRLRDARPPLGNVYLCSPSPDCEVERLAISNQLVDSGYRVVTGIGDDLPARLPELRTIVRQRMRESMLVVHLAGDDVRAPDSVFGDLELEEVAAALEIAATADGPPFFLWLNGAEPSMTRPSINQVLKSQLNYERISTSRLPFDKLKTDLKAKLLALRQ